MKAQWQLLGARYDALALRERWLIGAALLAGIVLIGYSLFIEPAMQRGQAAERSLIEQQTQFSSLRAQSAALQSGQQNPDFVAAAELARLKNELADLAGRLARVEGALVPPQRMAALLEEMIGHKSSLRLLSLKTFAMAPLLLGKSGRGEPAKGADQAGNPPLGLFKHGIEIKLEGSYQDLTAYLERLEQAKIKLLWSSVSLSTDKQPKLLLTLTVYTVSLDSAWLIV